MDILPKPLAPVLNDSARTTLAATASYLIARLSGLPEPYWAAIMTLVIIQSSLGATLKISCDRFIGTLIGAVLSTTLGILLPQNVWTFALAVLLLGLICSALRLQNSYRFAAITAAIVMLLPRTTPHWSIALHRFVEVSIGIVVGLAVSAIWQDAEPGKG